MGTLLFGAGFGRPKAILLPLKMVYCDHEEDISNSKGR